MESRPTLDQMWLAVAFICSSRSTCQQRKVGCVITNHEMSRDLGAGYNGNYAGGPNKCDFPDATGEARCGCIHAEDSAIAKSSFGCDLVAFCTIMPCSSCAKKLYNIGVRRIVTIQKDSEYRENKPYRRDSAELLREMNVKIDYISPKIIKQMLSNIIKDLL